MAKAAVEMAVLDAELRAEGRTLASRLGAERDRVPAGVSIGLADSVPALLATIASHVAVGYRRVKLKIQPGWDVEPVQAVRARFGVELELQVDANGAYTLDDAAHLAELDGFGLLLIEQPLAVDDLRGHAELGQRIDTPICLDESITSTTAAAEAIERGACRVVNVKAGRVGGYLEAVRIHDVCVAAGVPVWCGGMLETGLGRAANIALAALPGFTLTGDLSASSRWFAEDLTEPIELVDGHLLVPTDAGLGVTPRPEVLARRTTGTALVEPL
jgi:O-succinylbenzoate synthase